MSIKSLGYDEINNRVIKLREIAEWYPPHQLFVINPKAAKFLESNPIAPLVAVICDQDIRAEYAWEFPFWLYQHVGIRNFDASNVYRLGPTILRNHLDTYMNGKWPSGMSLDKQIRYLDNISNYIINTCKLIDSKFNNDPDIMFKLGAYSVPQIYFILRSLPGFGAKKASMTARNFASSGDMWFRGLKKRLKKKLGIIVKVNMKHFSEVPVDIHAVKVYGRMMGEFKRTPPRQDFPNYSPDIQNLAKLVFPNFPSKLDIILWAVGREYCDERNPACQECPLHDLPCEYSKYD